MKTAFITTRIRPFKKIFVVKSDDIAAFQTIYTAIADEVDQIYNLIIPIDDLFYLDSTKEFISRFDPDILFNFSDENDRTIEDRFQVKTVKPDPDVWRLGRFGTNLMSFSVPPIWSRRLGASAPTSVFASKYLTNTPESLLQSVNFGYVPDIEELNLEASIFNDVSIDYICELEDVNSSIFDHEKKFCHLTTHIGFGDGGGTSIWEIDYNRPRHFDKGTSVFVGGSSNLSFLYYFWNSRAYHSFSNMVWIPLELLEGFRDIIAAQSDLKFYVADDDTKVVIENLFESASTLIVDRYYFSGAKTRWKCFNHSQTIQVSDDIGYVQHPIEKTFSDIGICGFVIEVQGFEEFVYPVRSTFWDLFNPKTGHWQLFQQRFKRIGIRGLANYSLNVSFDNAPMGVEFPLPSFKQVMHHLFLSKDIEIQETPKTRLLSEFINLIGGLDNAGEVCQKHIFDLLYLSSPTIKTEAALKKLFPNSNGSDHDSKVEAVNKAVENGTVEVSTIFATADDLYNKAKITDQALKKAAFFATLQKLYDSRLFLRGKSFDCPMCASKVWLPLERLSASNYCPDCGNVVTIPVHTNGSVDKDKYRLNQLVVRAVDQGQLSTLLLLNLLKKQSFRIFDFIANVEILRKGTVFSDADILFRWGKNIGIAECKSSRSFSENQINSMVDIIKTFDLNFGLFSCLLSSDSPELVESIEFIRRKNLDFPILIITKEVLFSSQEIKLHRYLEVSSDERFRSGPVVVVPNNRANA